MYAKAEEDAIEAQLQERANLFSKELVKVSERSHDSWAMKNNVISDFIKFL